VLLCWCVWDVYVKASLFVSGKKLKKKKTSSLTATSSAGVWNEALTFTSLSRSEQTEISSVHIRFWHSAVSFTTYVFYAISICNHLFCFFTARCIIVQSAVLRSHVVCPSDCLSVCPYVYDVGRLKILETNCVNSKPNIFALRSPKVIHLLPANMEKFCRGNVRSTPTCVMSGWIESTESHVILGGGVLFVYFCRRITRSSLRYHSFLVFVCYIHTWKLYWKDDRTHQVYNKNEK